MRRGVRLLPKCAHGGLLGVCVPASGGAYRLIIYWTRGGRSLRPDTTRSVSVGSCGNSENYSAWGSLIIGGLLAKERTAGAGLSTPTTFFQTISHSYTRSNNLSRGHAGDRVAKAAKRGLGVLAKVITTPVPSQATTSLSTRAAANYYVAC